MKTFEWIRSWRQADDLRPSLPGEHWAVLGLALSLFGAARRARSPFGRIVCGAAAMALMARAASGRDGLLRVTRR